MNISDEKLYELCQKYGQQARTWRQKFAGLLPEVARRKLYEKKGFGSIFEFAAKLAGMSEEQVKVVLNLDRRFEDKPLLKGMLERGEVSINKLARVVSVASSENEEFWASQVKLLPNRALETLVRDEKMVQKSAAGDYDLDGFLHVHSNLSQNLQNASGAAVGNIEKVFFSGTSENRGQQMQHDNFANLNLSPAVCQRLLDLQQRGIDINKLILEMLDQREREIAQEKAKIAQAMKKEEELAREAELHDIPVQNSRHIPAKITKLINKEFGTKCAVSLCLNPSSEIHHTQRFSLSQSHNPYFLAPLCKAHHQIVHAIDVKVQEKRQQASSAQDIEDCEMIANREKLQARYKKSSQSGEGDLSLSSDI